ncbi:MAG: ceramidase domain-containing protein [Alphaproteobacteria bacterium]
MDWSKVYSYCERGGDPSFWAEPLNAVSNGAFIIAGLIAAVQLARAKRPDRALFEWLLVVLVLAIGTGSFLFHTYATVWSIPFDTIPIALFMLGYLGYALCRFVGLPWIGVALALALFYAAIHFAQGITCSNELLPVTRAAGKRCFNGTLGYAPAFVALILVGAVLAWQKHPAARYLFLAGAVFLASMTFRTLDIEVCARTRLDGRVLGTHYLWHILNAVVLYTLLLGAIRFGAPGAGRTIAPPGRSAP